MKINLQISYEDKTVREVVANASDMVAFEDKYSMSVASLSTDPRMSYLLFLAWHSEHRTKATTLDFTKWLETVDQVGAGDADPKSKG